jgi:hypothetical protein
MITKRYFLSSEPTGENNINDTGRRNKESRVARLERKKKPKRQGRTLQKESINETGKTNTESRVP